MVSQEWVYKNIFNMSDDEWKLEQGKVIGDLKLGFRHEQIESEGNDPIKSGESFGTPHDLAMYYNKVVKITMNHRMSTEIQVFQVNLAHPRVGLMVQEDHQKQVLIKLIKIRLVETH